MTLSSWETDPALTLGMSIFETFAVSSKGEILALEDHLERLSNSAHWLGISFSSSSIKVRLQSALDAWYSAHLGFEESDQPLALRYTLSISGLDHISIRSYPREYVGSIIKVAPILHPPSPYLPRTIKHSNRAEWRYAARIHQVDEVLLCDELGEILEAEQSAIFALDHGVLLYPPFQDGRRLESISFKRILRLSKDLGFKVREAPIKIYEPREMLCLSSSLKGIALAHMMGHGDPRLRYEHEHQLQWTQTQYVSRESQRVWDLLKTQITKEMGI